MGWCTQHLTYFMMDELKLCKAMGKVTLRLRYVLGSCAVSCKNVYSFFIHMIHILPSSQQVCQSVWKSLKKKPKIDHIWKSRSTNRRNIAVCVKVKMRHFWWFSNIVCPFSLSNASKVDNLLLSAVPSLNYASTSLKKKFLFVSKRVFDVYGHFTQKWGWIPQSFFKILINECEFFCLMNNSLCFCWFFRYVIAPMSLFLLATIPLPSAGIKGRSGY